MIKIITLLSWQGSPKMTLGIRSAFVLALLFSCPAHAVDSVAKALKSWGLLGKWGTHCHMLAYGNEPVKPDVTFAIEPDGKLIYENSGNIGDVTAASANDDGSITVKLQFFRPNNDNRTMVVEKVGQGIRTILNRNERNEYSIRNGIIVATGKEVSLLYKCP